MKTTDTKPMEEQGPAIDTSKMNAGQRAALELTEEARDADTKSGSFAQGVFMGECDLHRLLPYPTQSHEDMDQGDAFIQRLEKFLREKADPDEIDRTGEIPGEVIKGLGDMGAFAIKIHPQYGGLGLSQTNYCRAATVDFVWHGRAEEALPPALWKRRD
jgi:alkylation response protein AidB-like acyl-CoA dehydrogenase